MDSGEDHQQDAVCHAATSAGQLDPDVDVGTIEVIVTFLRTQAKLARSMDEHFRRFGLTSAKFDLLLVLHKSHEQRLTMWEIGEKLSVTRTNVTGLVDGLQRDNLVQRLAHPEDRRSLLVVLQPEGEALLQRALPGTWRRMGDLLGSFRLDEKSEMLRLGRKPRAALCQRRA